MIRKREEIEPRFFGGQEDAWVSDADIKVLLGGHGSGKGHWASFETMVLAIKHRYDAAYRANRPLIGVIAPSYNNVVNNQLKAIKTWLPKEAIEKESLNASNACIRLINGCEIRGFTFGSSAIEGTSFCSAWIDEAHLAPQYVLQNVMSRYGRDPLAGQLGRPRKLLVTGVPEIGTAMESVFREPSPELRPFLDVFHISALDNPSRSDVQNAAQLASVPKEGMDIYVHGRWGASSGRVFPGFSQTRHLKKVAPDPLKPIYLGFDPGEKRCTAAVFCQEGTVSDHAGRPTKALYVVDAWSHWYPDANIDRMLERLANHPLRNSFAVIYHDPTMREAEKRLMRQYLPGVNQVGTEHGSKENECRVGITHINRALEDAHGVTRLFVSDHLAKSDRGIVRGLSRLRYKEGQTDRWQYDESFGHEVDALRYTVVGRLPLTPPRTGPLVTKSANPQVKKRPRR